MTGYIERLSDEIADILVREGVDYVQTKAVFKAARAKAGLRAPKEKRGAPARLTIEEALRFIDAAYAKRRPDRVDGPDPSGNRRARLGIRRPAR